MRTERKSLIGKTIGYWYVIGESIEVIRPNGKKGRKEKCLCKLCGKEKYVDRQHLLKGKTTNCGCANVKTGCYKNIKKYSSKLFVLLNSKKHGMTHTAFYKKYQHAKARCENINCERYNCYGGRGIKVEWKTFEEFKDDMYDSYLEHCKQYGEKDTTLDRIDVNGNYCKENCRWATRYEQMNNTQKSKRVMYMGIEYSSVSDLCHKIGRDADRAMIDSRIRRGMTAEEAVLTPRKFYVKKV